MAPSDVSPGATQTRASGPAARARPTPFAVLFVLGAVLSGVEWFQQWRDDVYVGDIARRVVAEAHAETPRDRVIALRDYLRGHVRFEDAAVGDWDRPFFRATAAETLASGDGYCGEVSRAFINLARTIDIPAQRVNLYGSMMHVVAEVELVPHQRLIVDAQNPPTIVDLEPLDEVILRPEFDDYYTLNLRRLHLGWLVSRVRLEMGALTFWLENPHALKAGLWMSLLLLMLAGRGGRAGLRVFLHRRGWVHRSTLASESQPPRDEK